MNQMSRRTLLTTAGGLSMAGMLSGCGASHSSTTAANGAINYWAAFASPDTEKYFRQHFIDTFNASNPASPVSMSAKQLQNLLQLTRTALAAGNAPDIIYSDGPATALGNTQAKLAIPLTEYAKTHDWAKKLLPWASQLATFDNEYACVPASYGAMVMYYHKPTFEKHGWTVPKTRVEFDRLCADASAQGILPVGGGNSGYRAQNEWFLTCALNSILGPSGMYDVLTAKTPLDADPVISAIDDFRRMITSGIWGGGPKRWFTNTDTDMFTGLAQGKVAIYMSGSWSFGSIKQFFSGAGANNDEWDWAPIPSLSEACPPGIFPLTIGTTLGINAKAKNPGACAAFLDHLLDQTRQLEYLAATGENPAPLAVAPEAFPATIDERVKRLYVEIPKTKNLGYASWTFFPPKTDTHMYTEFDKVITGAQTAKEFCAGWQKVFADERANGFNPNPFAPQL